MNRSNHGGESSAYRQNANLQALNKGISDRAEWPHPTAGLASDGGDIV